MDQVDREPTGQANPAQIRRSLARAERGAALDLTEATALLAARGEQPTVSVSPRPGSATSASGPPGVPESSPTPPRSSSR